MPPPHRDSAGHRDEVTAIVTARIADVPVLLTGGEDGTVRSWDRVTGTPTAGPLEASTHRAVRDLTFVDFGGRGLLVTCHGQAEIRVWDLATRECLVQFETGQCVRALALTRIGNRTIAGTGGEDGTVQVWDCSLGRRLATLHLPETVTALAWDENQLAVCFGNETAVFTLHE